MPAQFVYCVGVAKSYKASIAEIVNRHNDLDDFWSTEVVIPNGERAKWVRMIRNPKHFTTAMFLGTWSDSRLHPSGDPIRLVRAMGMPDNSLRIVGRQGEHLYVLILEDAHKV